MNSTVIVLIIFVGMVLAVGSLPFAANDRTLKAAAWLAVVGIILAVGGVLLGILTVGVRQ